LELLAKTTIQNKQIKHMKVYTKTGDTGTTSLLRDSRTERSYRIESYGTVDELNSYIGPVRDQEMNTHYKDTLAEIQDRLFTIKYTGDTSRKKVKKNGELRLKTWES
jgi:cob(I)alamin adenosyltransferase